MTPRERSGIRLAAAGYALGMLHDLASRSRVPGIKPLLFLAMAAAHTTALVRLVRGGPRMPVPRAARWVAAPLAVASFGAMIYSILIEIPLRGAWLNRGHTDRLVTGGTYRLTRHPGVLWLSLGIVSLAVATRSRQLARAAGALIAGDVLHVWFQERFVLHREFGEPYAAYTRRTPMLVPTPASVRAFVRGADPAPPAAAAAAPGAERAPRGRDGYA